MKDSKKRSQRRKVFKILKEFPMTTKMIQVNTGIPRENITRYIATLEKARKVTVVKKAPCEITSHSAKFYSSQKKYFDPETQSELFPKRHHAGVLR